eukprot:6192351-Pleurochrysis_carterae.AAC.2
MLISSAFEILMRWAKSVGGGGGEGNWSLLHNALREHAHSASHSRPLLAPERFVSTSMFDERQL